MGMSRGRLARFFVIPSAARNPYCATTTYT
jgi:hypothetical protein